MIPKKRGRSSKVKHTASKFETPDDDVFEDEDRQPILRRKNLRSVKKEPSSSETKTTCQRKHNRATRNKVESNGKSDKANKHVDKNCNMSSQNSSESSIESINSIESEIDDFEQDLVSTRKTKYGADHDETIPSKRKKPNSPVISSDDNNVIITEARDINEQPHGESNDLQNEDAVSNKSNDESASYEVNSSEMGDELEIELDTEIELEPTEEHEPKESSESPNEPQPIEPIDTETEPAEPINKPNQNTNDGNDDNDNENDEDNDEIVLDVEYTDMFEGVEDDEPVPSSTSQPKKTNKMSIPHWKQAAVPTTESPIPKRQITRTVTLNVDAPAKVSQPQPRPSGSVPAPIQAPPTVTATSTAREGEQGRQPKVVFKIPQRPSICATTPNVATRDPRIAKSSTPNPATLVITSTVQNCTVTSQAAPVVNNTTDQRVSVKERLGNRFAVKHQPSTSFIIPSDSAPNSLPTNTANDEKPQPKPPGLYTNTFRLMQAAQQTTKNVQQPHPDLPSFVREALESKQLIELKIPSFATGTQKYEPLFFRLFERTCRVFMFDECNSHDCQFEHQLPDHDMVRKTLDRIGNERTIEFYDEFICRNQKLFDFYLSEFTGYFGKHGMNAKLKQMVENCIERKVPFHFIKIVEGFMLSGKSFSKALSEVIVSITSRSIRTSKEVIKLVLHVRNDTIRPFVDVLDSISKQESFQFATEWVNRMMFIYRDIKVKALSDVIWRIINDNMANLHQYDNDLVAKFMEDYAQNG